MKLGVFGCRADSRGLHHQTQAYAKHLQPDRVFGIDMTVDNLSPYPCDWSAYDQSRLDVYPHSAITEDVARRWLKGLDVVLGAETFYRDEFPTWAKEMGVRTVLAVNPEFAPYWDPRSRHLPTPDVLLAPTTWRLEHMPGAIHLPFPVDRELFPFRLRSSAKKFVHVAGHKAASDRAGTRTVIGALPRLRDYDVVIRSQSPLGVSSPILNGKVEESNVPNPRLLYEDADVVILPRRYGGNHLVANEALSSGVPVIALDRIPESQWGGVYIIPCRQKGIIRTKAGHIPLHIARDNELMRAVRNLAAAPETVEKLSYAADSYVATISWDALLPRYQDILRA